MQLFNQFNKSTKRYPNLDTAEGSTLRAYGNIKKNLKEGLFCSIKNAEETYAYFGCFGVKKSLVHSFSTHNKGDLKQVISVVRSYKPVTPSLRHRVVISPQICKKS